MAIDDIPRTGRGIQRAPEGALGCALRAARMKYFVSQASLAKVAGVHQSQVSRLELGAPNWTLFCRLVEALEGKAVVTVEVVPPEIRALQRLKDTIW